MLLSFGIAPSLCIDGAGAGGRMLALSHKGGSGLECSNISTGIGEALRNCS